MCYTQLPHHPPWAQPQPVTTQSSRGGKQGMAVSHKAVMQQGRPLGHLRGGRTHGNVWASLVFVKSSKVRTIGCTGEATRSPPQVGCVGVGKAGERGRHMLFRCSEMCSVPPGLKQDPIRTTGGAWAQLPYAPYSRHSGLKVRNGALGLTLRLPPRHRREPCCLHSCKKACVWWGCGGAGALEGGWRDVRLDGGGRARRCEYFPQATPEKTQPKPF